MMTRHIRSMPVDHFPIKLEMTTWLAGELMAACRTAEKEFPNSEFSVTLNWLWMALGEAGAVTKKDRLPTARAMNILKPT